MGSLTDLNRNIGQLLTTEVGEGGARGMCFDTLNI